MSKTQKNFLSGAIILSVANILVKIIGGIYKIPLVWLMGGTGMGYYNDAYQIYAMLFIISTAGIPVAISKMVSESNTLNRTKEPKKILKIAVISFAIIGFIGMAVMVLGVRVFTMVIKNPNADLSIIAIAPAIFFVSMTSAFKGYFQGYKNMTPTAVYQIIEAIAKLIGLGIVAFLISMGYKENYRVLAAGAVLGVSFGSFCSAIFMFLRYFFGKKEVINETNYVKSRTTSTILAQIIKIAIPVTLSSAVMSLTSFIDMVFVKRSLNSIASFTVEKANFYYGSFTGCCYSLFNLPTAITLTVGVSVLPFISSALAGGNKDEAHRHMKSSMKVVSLLAMPCVTGLFFMARPILNFLYSSRPDEVSIAILPMRILALSIFFVSFVSLLNVILQASGKVNIPMYTMFAGAVAKIFINVTLVRIPSININGAPIGSFCCYGLIVLLDLIFIKKYTGFTMPFKNIVLKPLLCAIACGATGISVYLLLEKISVNLYISTMISLVVAVIVYVICVIGFKILEKDDIMLLPKGDKIYSLLNKRGLIK